MLRNPQQNLLTVPIGKATNCREKRSRCLKTKTLRNYLVNHLIF